MAIRTIKSRSIRFGLLIAGAFSILDAIAITHSCSSTAAIGLLFLPFYALAVGIACAVLTALYLKGLARLSNPTAYKSVTALLLLPPVLIAICVLSLFIAGLYTTANLNRIKSMEQAPLEKYYARLKPWDCFYAHKIDAIAHNEHASSQLLDKIAHQATPTLSKSLRSFFTVINTVNCHGTPALVAITRNPNVQDSTILYIVQHVDLDSNVLANVAIDPHAPPAALAEIYRRNKQWMSRYLLDNPNTPANIREQIVRDTPPIKRNTNNLPKQ